MQISAQAVMLTRTYAFTGKKKAILVIFIFGFALLVAIAVWFIGIRFELRSNFFLYVANTGCYGNSPNATYNNNKPALGTGLVFLFTFLLDAFAILLVLWYAIRAKSYQGPLGRAFVLQSLSYFIMMSSLNLITATFFL
ncbi:hypothetical protein SERLADRAFT_470386, partial [Serpula lacrymans var. lacrymans S7.9]